MSTKSKVLLGILGAAAAGVAIGLLIAPEEGSKVRGRLRKTATSWANSLSTLFSNAKGELEEAKGELEEAKGKLKQGRSAAEDKVNKLKESFS